MEDFADQMEELGIACTTEGVGWDTAYDRALADPLLWGWGAHTPMELITFTIQKKRAAPPGIPPMEMRRWTHIWIRRCKRGSGRILCPVAEGPVGRDHRRDPGGGYPWVWLVNIDHLYWCGTALGWRSRRSILTATAGL